MMQAASAAAIESRFMRGDHKPKECLAKSLRDLATTVDTEDRRLNTLDEQGFASVSPVSSVVKRFLFSSFRVFVWLWIAAAPGDGRSAAQEPAREACADTAGSAGRGDDDLYCIELLPAQGIDRAAGTARLL